MDWFSLFIEEGRDLYLRELLSKVDIGIDTWEYSDFVKTSVRNGHFKVTECLLGMDLFKELMERDPDCFLRCLADNFCIDAIDLFCRYGMSLNAGDSFIARHAVDRGDIDRLRYAVRHGSNLLPLHHASYRNPLMLAIIKNNLEIIKYILSHREWSPQELSTPLFEAIHQSNLKIIKLLIDAGADAKRHMNIMSPDLRKNLGMSGYFDKPDRDRRKGVSKHRNSDVRVNRRKISQYKQSKMLEMW